MMVVTKIPENWPRIRIPDSSNIWILDSTVWIPDCKAIKSRILDSLTWGNTMMVIIMVIVYYYGGGDGFDYVCCG